MRVGVSLKVNLKDRPKEYLGITGEDYTIGTDNEVTLANMIIAFVHIVGPMYAACYPVEALNKELMEASQRLWNMRLGE